jgi:predicted ribosome quality control (RQC) complex YloA/Tae2 family protein
LARIEQLQADLALAETPQEIALVREEIVEAGYLRAKPDPRPRKQPKGGKGKQGKQGNQQGKRTAQGGTPLRRESSDGFTLLVGKNSRQNEEVTFHLATAHDLWLHARGVPGAHVIVKSGGRLVPETTLREAAALAAYYSQARENGRVAVDYTEQRYVRHMKGGGAGMVVYERERTLHVTPGDTGNE